jgi:hypothetical protein
MSPTMERSMPELAEPADASLEVITHPDAEIFLIGNDRQLIARAVGRLATRQPKGLYRLKVMRATAAVEQILELDQDLSKVVEVAGFDTVVPFMRTLGEANQNALQALAGQASSANVVLVGRMPTPPGGRSTNKRAPHARSPLASFRLLRWGETEGDANGIEGTQSSFGNECWQIAGKSCLPGDYVLEFSDGVRITRQSVPVLPNWQTRIYVRRLAPNAAIDPSGLRPQDVMDVALHLSEPGRPLALEPEFEPSEVVRIALAAGRRIVSSREVLDIFLNEKFFDPLAGVAAAHLMFDGLERAEADATSTRTSKARLALQITRSDVQTVMGNLIGLMHMAQGVSTDMVALKLRAGMSLTDAEKMIATPPLYMRSWEGLIAVSLGASPKVVFAPNVYRQCVANYAAGPYFAWAPTSVADYVAQLIGSNRQTLQDVAASLSARVSEAEPMSIEEISKSVVSLVGTTNVDFANVATDATNLQELLGPGQWRGLANAINQTEWMKQIGGRLATSDMDRLRTARDIAHAIGAKVATASSASRVSEARKTLSSPAELVVALADEKNRTKFADRLNIPRSMLDAMLLPADDAQPAIPAALEAPAGPPSAEPSRNESST